MDMYVDDLAALLDTCDLREATLVDHSTDRARSHTILAAIK
jgi:hypothetical protein